jgi:hypothetical protein
VIDDVTLAPETYDVLTRVPLDWWSVMDTEHAIATATNRSLGDVRRRLTHLRGLKLIEYRRRQTIAPAFEIRRVAK